MTKLIDLDGVVLAVEAFAAWKQLARAAAPGRPIADPAAVSDEQARIEDDDALTIFVALPDGREVSMRVPPEQWTRKQGRR